MQMKNPYMKKVNNNINVSKIIEILDLGREITDIYSLFDKDRLKLYSNPKDIRFKFKYFENIIVRPLFSEYHICKIDIDIKQEEKIFLFFIRMFFAF